MSDWQDKIAFMRAHGVTHAEWDDVGRLLVADLGPMPKDANAEPPEKPQPNRVHALLHGGSSLKRKVRLSQ